MEVKNNRYGLVKKLVFILSISSIFTMNIHAFPTGKYNCKHPIGQFEYILESNGKAKSIMRPMGTDVVMEGRGRWINDYDTAILIFNGERGTRSYIHKEGNNFFLGEENVIIRMAPCQSTNATGNKQEYNQPQIATTLPKVNNSIPPKTGPKFSSRVCDELSDETHFFLPKYIKKASTYNEYLVAFNKLKSSYQKQYNHCDLLYKYVNSEVVKSADQWQKEFDKRMINRTGARRDAFTGWGADGTLSGPDFTYVD